MKGRDSMFQKFWRIKRDVFYWLEMGGFGFKRFRDLLVSFWTKGTKSGIYINLEIYLGTEHDILQVGSKM